ncbi:hypothetical protein OIV83_001027 [Microbotryomycetes sp. JL201]|nr:hypothetical protein OIV83_001027 [Microbotryomycetes sp. JL201]
MASSNQHRWSRVGLGQSQLAPPASTGADPGTTTTKGERRLSRMTQADFDSLLDSGQTIVIPGLMDETRLGEHKASDAVDSSPELGRDHAVDVDTRHKYPTDRGVDASTRSKSMSAAPAVPSKDPMERRRHSEYPQAAAQHASAPTTPSRASARLPSAPSSASRKYSGTAGYQVPPALAPSPVPQHQGSFSQAPAGQHILAGAQDRKPSTSSLGNFSWSSSSALSPATASATTTHNSAGSHRQDDDKGRTTLASTMRRTSRFFRKLGVGSGSSSQTESRTEASEATARTPIADTFSTVHQPSPATRPINASDTFDPLDSSAPRPSASVNRQAVNEKNPDLPPKSPSLTRLDSTDSSRVKRDSSVSSLVKMTSPRYGPAGSAALTTPSSRTTRGEEEQLRRELRRWQLDQEGVLGVGEGSNGTSSRGTSMPPTPMSKADYTSYVGSDRSTPRRPSFQGEWSSAGRESTYDSLVSLQQRSASLPTNKLDADLTGDLKEELRADNADAVSRKKELPQSPAVPSPDEAVELPSRMSRESSDLRRPSTTSQITVQGSSDGDGPSINEIGLGLGKIDEGRSREATTESVADSNASSAYPVINAEEDAAFKPATVPTDLFIDARRATNRQSVVMLPSLGSTNVFRTAKPVKRDFDCMPGEDEDARGQSLEVRAQRLAQRCWDEDPGFLDPKKVATWLGSPAALSSLTLRRWIVFFDFAGLRLDVAFRRLCSKIYLKAETQQVDRILAQFSRRYHETNPGSLYGSADVVHAVAYSLLLLNTDLHVVDSASRMSRQQFVRNTLSAVQTLGEENSDTQPALLFGDNGEASKEEEADQVFGNGGTTTPRQAIALTNKLSQSSNDPTPASPQRNGSPNLSRTVQTTDSPRVASLANPSSTTLDSELSSGKPVEAKLEAVLKEMYNSIKSHPIFQPLESNTSASTSRTSLSLPAAGPGQYATFNSVNRATSRRSIASSTMSGGTGSSNAFKRSSTLGFGSLLSPQGSGHEGLRPPSPSPSTATSFTDDHFNTAYGAASNYHHQVPTVGFANSLSHSIIREQQEDETPHHNVHADDDDVVEITDEELALMGAPWAKEGLVWRKHYWETAGKRSKEKSWLQVFVVAGKGELQMFRFDGAGSGAAGNRQSTRFGAGLGGGDWTSNANAVGSVSLIHALCSAMPPPGYNKSRPHCFVLTLPSGGTYFFQTGTPDLVQEWVSTCNYWAARLSKTALPGGVSNMEYGWNRLDVQTVDSRLRHSVSFDHGNSIDDTMSVKSGKSKRSYQVSLAHSHASSGLGGGTSAASTRDVNDKIHINDWQVPPPPSGSSQLSEDAQLENLRRHLALVKEDILQHNMIRVPLTRLYSSRNANASKALANWDRKSKHLLSESVKYQTYIEALSSAIKLRSLKRGQKQIEQMLRQADQVEDEDEPEVLHGLGASKMEVAEQDGAGEAEQSVRLVGSVADEPATSTDVNSTSLDLRSSVYIDARSSDVSPVVG